MDFSTPLAPGLDLTQVIGTGAGAYLQISRRWTNLSPVSPPTARRTGGVFDQRNGRLLIFGGQELPSGTAKNDTWVFNVAGGSWTQKSPSASPPARAAGYALAYGTTTGKAYLFGGTTTTELNDFWTYDVSVDSTWVQVTGGSSPTARGGTAAAYDESGARLVVFGGGDTGAEAWSNQTWLYTTSWSSFTQVTSSPSARGYTGLAYAGNGKVVLFGGETGGAPLSDTWVFDSGGWTQKAAAPAGLTARRWHQMTYDPNLDRVVLYGGLDSLNARLDDVWFYNLAVDSWVRVAAGVSPGGRRAAAFGFGAAQNKAFLFGGDTTGSVGMNETWSYETRSTGTFTSGELPISGAQSGSPVIWGKISWGPGSQPVGTTLGFQVAANIGNGIWTFKGPGGTTASSDLYVSPPANINTGSVDWGGTNHLRFKAFLTGVSTATPRVDDVTITYNFPPGAPSGLSPSGHSSTTNTQPVFSWAASTDLDSDALRYEIQVATSTDFSPATISSFGVAGTSYTHPIPLSEAQYFWRVRAIDDPNATSFPGIIAPQTVSNWSTPVSSFEVVATVRVDTPNGGEVWLSTRPINWTLTGAATTHTFNVKLVSIFDPTCSLSGTIPCATMASGLPNGTTTYNWDTRTVPNNNTSGYAIRVEAVTPTGGVSADASNAGFNVVNDSTTNPLQFSLLQPNGGEFWASTQTITWTFPYPFAKSADVRDADDNAPAPYNMFEVSVSTLSGAAGSWVTVQGPPWSAPHWEAQPGTGQPITQTVWNTTQLPNGTNNPPSLSTYKVKVFLKDFGSPPREGTVISAAPFTVIVGNLPPNPFSLVSPANGSSVSTVMPTLVWAKTSNPGNEDATGDVVIYTLHYSTDAAFAGAGNPVTINAFKNKTSITFSTATFKANASGQLQYALAGLADGTTYYWKVVAADANQSQVVSTQLDWWFLVNVGQAKVGDVDIVSGVVGLPQGKRVQVKLISETSTDPQDPVVAQLANRVKTANTSIKAIQTLKTFATEVFDIAIVSDDASAQRDTSASVIKATVTLPYPDVDGDGRVDGTLIDVKFLRLFTVNEANNSWELVPGSQANPVTKKVEASVSHFSLYRAMAFAPPATTLSGLFNFPNPFGEQANLARAKTKISYVLLKDSEVTLRIFNLVGDLVWEKVIPAGGNFDGGKGDPTGVKPNLVEWDGRNGDGLLVANGAYLLHLVAKPADGSPAERAFRKIAVLK